MSVLTLDQIGGWSEEVKGLTYRAHVDIDGGEDVLARVCNFATAFRKAGWTVWRPSTPEHLPGEVFDSGPETGALGRAKADEALARMLGAGRVCSDCGKPEAEHAAYNGQPAIFNYATLDTPEQCGEWIPALSPAGGSAEVEVEAGAASNAYAPKLALCVRGDDPLNEERWRVRAASEPLGPCEVKAAVFYSGPVCEKVFPLGGGPGVVASLRSRLAAAERERDEGARRLACAVGKVTVTETERDDALSRLAAAEERAQRAEGRIAEIEADVLKGPVCVWCDARTPREPVDTLPDRVLDHVRTCEANPYQALAMVVQRVAKASREQSTDLLLNALDLAEGVALMLDDGGIPDARRLAALVEQWDREGVVPGDDGDGGAR